MGAIIKASAVSRATHTSSSITLATLASEECIAKADVNKSDIALLFNVGINRDDNMVEPSMASLIQKELGMNTDYIKDAIKKTTASFDVMNGACGAINAVQVAEAFFATSDARFALIVSSEAHPSSKRVSEFPYETMGSAVLLERGCDAAKGFLNPQFRMSQNTHVGSETYTKLYQKDSRVSLNIETHPEYQYMLNEFLAESALEYVKKHSLSTANSLLVCSQTFGY